MGGNATANKDMNISAQYDKSKAEKLRHGCHVIL
jgi:hypothetical protein